MRIVTRSLVASAVAVPLLFVGTGAAFASEDTSTTVGLDTEANLSTSYNGYDNDDNGLLGDLLGDDVLGNDDDNRDSRDNDDDGILGDLLGDDVLGGDDDNRYDNDDDQILGSLLG